VGEESRVIWIAGPAAALVAWLGLYPVTRWLVRRRVVDVPNERSSHEAPTPRGGGLVIVVVALAGAGWACPWFAAAALAIAIVSWVDDLRSVKTIIRFGVHSIAAVLVLWSCGPVRVADFHFATLNLGVAAYPLTFLWIVGLTNAYNFMDGIDGIAAGQGLVAGLGWAAIGQILHLPHLTLVGVLIAGASLGFLFHNWHPARVFMGDVGSTFLGFAFAVLPLLAKDARAPVAAVVLVWPFVIDACFTFLRRLLRRENVFSPHRSHVYQRLVIAGKSHALVTSIYMALAAAGAAIVWLFLYNSGVV
jgi:UDP-N-acetylmuramyl pentapeptide phosphotransferase/UDP-N-acetylglucosamine-1-phosphate transferase